LYFHIILYFHIYIFWELIKRPSYLLVRSNFTKSRSIKIKIFFQESSIVFESTITFSLSRYLYHWRKILRNGEKCLTRGMLILCRKQKVQQYLSIPFRRDKSQFPRAVNSCQWKSCFVRFPFPTYKKTRLRLSAFKHI